MFTIDEILKRKENIEKSKEEKIFIELDGKELVFKKCDLATLNDVRESSENPDAKLIYYTCISPNLKDNVLIEKLGCKNNPSLIAEKIFTNEEILEISHKILDLSGMLKGNLELKARIGSI